MAPDRMRRTRCYFLRGSLAVAGLGLVSGCAIAPVQQPAPMPRGGYLPGGGGQEGADTFQALGLTIPPSVLQQATELIQ